MNAPEPRRLLVVAPSPNAQRIAALNEAIGTAEKHATPETKALAGLLRALPSVNEHDGIVLLDALADFWEERSTLAFADAIMPRRLHDVILSLHRQMLDDEAPDNCDECGGSGSYRHGPQTCPACNGTGKATS